jgi:hypothetical protein
MPSSYKNGLRCNLVIKKIITNKAYHNYDTSYSLILYVCNLAWPLGLRQHFCHPCPLRLGHHPHTFLSKPQIMNKYHLILRYNCCQGLHGVQHVTI